MVEKLFKESMEIKEEQKLYTLPTGYMGFESIIKCSDLLRNKNTSVVDEAQIV